MGSSAGPAAGQPFRRRLHPTPWELRRYGTEGQSGENAAFSLVTSAEDYGRFLAYLMRRGGLAESTYEEMLTPNSRNGLGIAGEIAAIVVGDMQATVTWLGYERTGSPADGGS